MQFKSPLLAYANNIKHKLTIALNIQKKISVS